MDRTSELLDEVLDTYALYGRACDGWVLQRLGKTYAAWVYREDAGGAHVSLIAEVEAQPTMELAAEWLLQYTLGMLEGPEAT
jgi:hypothetical protein